MASQEVKVLGLWVSPFVFRVKWALKLKGVEYEYVEEVLNNKSPLLLESNPVHKKVPVLIHGGKAICESLNIVEYIDETWKQNPILPKDPYEEATVRFWAKFSEEKLLGAMFKVFTLKGKERDAAADEAKEALDILENVVKEKKFVGGENIQYLDIVLGWTCLWWETTEEVLCLKLSDSIKHPHYSEWMKNFRELPLIKESLPPKDKVIAYMQNLHQ